MKTIKYLTIASLLALTVVSCKDNKEVVEINPQKIVAAQFIDLPTATVVLDENNPDGMAPILFSWSKADFSYQASITYTVEAAADGSEVYTELLQSTKVYNTMTNKGLNNKLLGMKIKPNEISLLKLRVISSIGASYKDTISQVQTIQVKPYKTVIVYPSLGLAGSFQGWAPGNPNTRIWSVDNNGKYTGWIDMVTTDAIEFKFVNGFDWGTDLGGPPATVAADGKISGTIAGGDNIKGVPSGYYRVDCNWTAKTYTMTPVKSWGIVGDATPGEWNNSTPMVYNKDTNLWTIDVTMKDGEWKFRADNGWDISYGKGEDDGELVVGGDNIKITAGSYTITLNLGVAIPTYEIVKK